MVVLSIVLGSKKKKKPVQPQGHGEPTVSDSPWDDLMRELRKAQDPDRTPEDVYGLPDTEESKEAFEEEPRPVFRMEPPTPAYSPSPSPVPEPVSAPYFSYDDENVEENYFSYDSYNEQIENTVHAQAVSSLAAPEEPEPLSVSEREPEDGIFNEGFDPRLAVLYSEVFRPKYVK